MKNRLINSLGRVAQVIDGFTETTGKVVSWLVLLLVAIVSYDVGMRYLLQSGSIAIQELEWHLFSLIFLIGAAYTLKHDDHVRVDIIYQGRYMNDYRRAWVNLLGGIFFLIPFCILIILSSWSFVSLSYIHNEISPDPGGLPYRWLIKAAIPLSFLLLFLQGLVSIIKNLLTIMDKPR